MGHPVSVRLDEHIQTTLEEAAKARGIGLSTYLRELAVHEAARVRRERSEITPTAENCCTKPCYALAHHVTTASKQRVTPTPSCITDIQLAKIRQLISIPTSRYSALTQPRLAYDRPSD